MITIRINSFFKMESKDKFKFVLIKPSLELSIVGNRVVSHVDDDYICRTLVADTDNGEFHGHYYILSNRNVIKITKELSNSYGFLRQFHMFYTLELYRDIALGCPSLKFAMSIIAL